MFRFGLQNLKFRKITFFLYALVSILSVPSRLIQDDSSFAFLLLCLAIGALITAIMLPLLWLVCFLNQKFELGNKNILYPLALIALVGAMRGEILHLFIRELGLEDNLSHYLAALSSTIFTSIYFLTISSFIESVLHRRDRFNQIFAQASLLIANPSSVLDEKMDPRSLYLSTLDRIKSSVKSVGIEGEKLEPHVLHEASRVIQSQINEVLRPLSHRLWVNSIGQIKHRHLLSILKDAIENLDFSVKYILAYQFFIGGYGISLVIGFKSSLYVTIIGTVTSIVLILGYTFVREQVKKNFFLLGLTFLVLEGLLPVFIPLAFRNSLNESASAIGGLLISPSIPGLILLNSAYRLIIRDGDMAIGAATSVKYRVASLTSGDMPAESGVELAEYLHNSLQSELFGISKRLEAASQGMPGADPTEALQSLESVLNRSFQDISTNQLGGIMRIQKLITSWQGIARIDVSGLHVLEEGSSLSKRTALILEELITNSIRYGEADDIKVELIKDLSHLQIVLIHNGKGEITKKSGLGSMLLSGHSPGGLEISSQSGKTHLRVKIPTNLVS
jgi:anti-sigma regulatory factor (Ser/Thr protein kinase)